LPRGLSVGPSLSPAWLWASVGIFVANHTGPYLLIWVVLSVAPHVACSAALSTPSNGPCVASALGPARRPRQAGARPDRASNAVQPRGPGLAPGPDPGGRGAPGGPGGRHPRHRRR